MKQLTNNAFNPLNEAELKTLCTEAKETRLTESEMKKFSAVDLWAIQRNRKPTTLRKQTAIFSTL